MGNANGNGNGTAATRAELAAHIKGIDNHFDSVEADIKEIRFDLRELHAELQAGFRLVQEAQWLGPQGRVLVSGVVAALVSVVIALGVALLK